MTLRYIRSSVVSANGAKVFWGGCWFQGVSGRGVRVSIHGGVGGLSTKKNGGLFARALITKNRLVDSDQAAVKIFLFEGRAGAGAGGDAGQRLASSRSDPKGPPDLVVRFGGLGCRGTSGTSGRGTLFTPPPSKRWQWVGAKRSAAEDRRRPYQLPIPSRRASIKDRNRPIACLSSLQLFLCKPGPGCWHRPLPLVQNASVDTPPLFTSLTAFLRSFAFRLPPL